MSSKSSTKKGNLREIERSYPKGTIYTIYSINLRNLYELTTEKEDRQTIEDIKLQSILITWVKARYLQMLYPLENHSNAQVLDLINFDFELNNFFFSNELNQSSEQCHEDLLQLAKEYSKKLNREIKNLAEKYKVKLKELIQKYTEKHNTKLENLTVNTEEPYEIVKEFTKELINMQGEVFYFSESILTKRNKAKNHLDSSSANFKILKITEILKKLKYEVNEIVTVTPTEFWNKAVECSIRSINEIKKLFEDQLKKYIDIYIFNYTSILNIRKWKELISYKFRTSRDSNDLFRIHKLSEINWLLITLNHTHSSINKEKRVIKGNIYKAFRGVEDFLVSDEFGKFAEDPFFKISKNQKRYINVSGKNCLLQNVTEHEEKLLEDGHEFLIFRGNLKDRWLTSLTYKIWSNEQQAAYFIRLSRLGLLQIRKEQYLGSNYKGKTNSSKIDNNFRKTLREYQSNNYLKTSGKFNAETLKTLFPEKYILAEEKAIPDDETKITNDEIKEAKTILQKQNIDKNLIDVLVRLLYSQRHYFDKENISVNIPAEVNNSDDVIQVAVGFAKLLEFRTNSNYSRSFQKGIPKDQLINSQESVVHPKDINEIRKSSQLERQKYTLIFLHDLKKSEKSKSSFIPQELHRKYPQAISCLLQGSLEKAEFSTALKIFQYSKGIPETGKIDEVTSESMNLIAYFSDGDGWQMIQNVGWHNNQQVKNHLSGTYLIPPIPESKSCKYEDLSTWENELCIFSPERGLIFFNDKETLESGNKLTPYRDYWRCIVRGVEYTVALRATLQLLEARTTRLLREIPELLGRPSQSTEENNTNIDEEILSGLTSDLASVLKILPGLRSIAIATNAFRSGHSVKKFEFLYNNCFNFEQTFANIQKNIDELTNFLTFFVQQEEAKDDRKLSKIALVFTVGSILYISVSFSQDFYSFFADSTFYAENITLIDKTLSVIKEAIGELTYSKLLLWKTLWTKILIILLFSGIFWIVWSAIRSIKPQYNLIGVIKKVVKKMWGDVPKILKVVLFITFLIPMILFILSFLLYK